MGREFPLWVIVALPWFAGLVALLLARPLVAVLGPRKAGVFGHYLALGASALALLFIGQTLEFLMAPDDPRALAHTPLAGLIPSIAIGEVRVALTLIADRLSATTVLVLAGAFTLARIFMAGPAAQRDLGLDAEQGRASEAALRRIGLLGLLEGAASLVVLAGDLALAAIGWAILGIGAAAAVAREVGDERRASAATRVLAMSIAGDLALGAAAVLLVVAGIGLAHNEMWAPLTGDHLYASGLLGIPNADAIAIALVGAALLRMSSLAWAGNSVLEALLDAVLIPIPAVYLLLRYQRVLAYAPTVLAGVLVIGMILALVAAVVGLVRPAHGFARKSARPGVELGLAGTGLAWTGLIAMALGVGAWRTVVLLILAAALGRLGLRLALIVAERDRQLPPWTAQIVRVLGWAVAGLAPGLGFVALAQTLLDVLTRASLLAPWVSWPAAIVVLIVAFVHAAAVARLWYENLARKPGGEEEGDEDGLDFTPIALALIGLAGLGLVSLLAWFEITASILAWLELMLPIAGGHEAAPLGIRPEFRAGIVVARPWVAGTAVLLALVTAFAWMWTRERFRRAHGSELASLARALELVLAPPRRIVRTIALVLAGLTELAARGIGRGVFEDGPQIAARLGRDWLSSWMSGWGPRSRQLALGGARAALLGVVLGAALLLGWLFGKREVASGLPSDDYGFGGLRPKLIRAGGEQGARRSQTDAGEASEASPELDAEAPASTPVAPIDLAPRRDDAEPAPIEPPPELQEGRR